MYTLCASVSVSKDNRVKERDWNQHTLWLFIAYKYKFGNFIHEEKHSSALIVRHSSFFRTFEYTSLLDHTYCLINQWFLTSYFWNYLLEISPVLKFTFTVVWFYTSIVCKCCALHGMVHADIVLRLVDHRLIFDIIYWAPWCK